MAKVNIGGLTEQLDEELWKALRATLREHFPDENFNSRAVLKTFKKEMAKRCNDWENIPNKYIRS